MWRKFSVAFLAGGLALAASAQQQVQTMRMPAREEFVDGQCIPAMYRVTVRADEASGAAFARAACECSYRLLAPHQEVSRRMFDDAGLVCRAEFETDPAAFLGKYLHRSSLP